MFLGRLVGVARSSGGGGRSSEAFGILHRGFVVAALVATQDFGLVDVVVAIVVDLVGVLGGDPEASERHGGGEMEQWDGNVSAGCLVTNASMFVEWFFGG